MQRLIHVCQGFTFTIDATGFDPQVKRNSLVTQKTKTFVENLLRPLHK